MELKNQIRINAKIEDVFDALNNPGILQNSIPGCESLEKISDTKMKATVITKIGPIKAKFTGTAVLSELNPPKSYTISGEGKGGTAGFAKGNASIKLIKESDATLMVYVVNAEVGGKLAQLGNRLIEGTSKRLAEQFFANFEENISQNMLPVNQKVLGAQAQNRSEIRIVSNRSIIWMLLGIIVIVCSIYLY